MEYTIVPMTSRHLDQVAELERICFSDPWSRQMLSEHLENECGATLVAEGADGTVLGYAGVLVILDEGYITNIAVRPAYRRQGVATELLEVFQRFAEGNHLTFLTLEVRAGNAGAQALYEKLGYEEVGRRRNYYEHPREDAVLMTKYFAGEEAASEDAAAHRE